VKHEVITVIIYATLNVKQPPGKSFKCKIYSFTWNGRNWYYCGIFSIMEDTRQFKTSSTLLAFVEIVKLHWRLLSYGLG